MLKILMLKRELDLKEAELRALDGKDAAFEAREAELTQSIGEVETEEQRSAMEAMVSEFDTARCAHDAAKTELRATIDALRAQITEAEANDPPAPAQSRGAEHHEERTAIPMTNTINFRSLPRNQRAFDALPLEQRSAIVAQDDVQEFLTQLRSYGAAKRDVTGAELTIPVVFLDIVSENMYRYSKLLRRVRVRNIRGEGRQTIGGIVPEAVWTECCDALNELNFSFNQITTDCYKVGGFVMVCNSLLADSDINLASEIVEMMSESLGLAKDKAILYGKGAASKMPLGIVTRLAQQTQPADYPANAPAWTDYHTSNIITIDASLTGAAFWSALVLAAGNTFTRYSRGEQFWAMNSKTYNLLKSKVITFTATGDVAANVFGVLPIINGDIEILEFMPDGDIVGGYGDLYLWAQREGMTIGSDMNGFTLRVRDNTLFFGKERADGTPIIAGAFVAININGAAVTTEMTFAANTANLALLESLAIDSKTLTPTFDPTVSTYSLAATSASAKIEATPQAAGAAVSISYDSKNIRNGGTVTWLADGAAHPLTITVANGNAVVVYTVNVTKSA